MKTFKTLTCILAIFSLLAALVQAGPRTWTNNAGKQIEAELLRVDGDKVRLQLSSNRQVFIIPIDTLSEEDRKFIAEEAIRMEEAKQAEKLASRDADWTEDWEEAQAEAKETGLPILLLMTGSDWCGYCIQLKDNVFDKSKFKDFADENLVLMMADFPRGSQSRSIKDQNAELKKEYTFSGYPTVFLLGDDLKPIARFGGYGGDSAEAYVAKLKAKLPADG